MLTVRRGLSIRPSSAAAHLKKIITRETFNPPPVLPADAPMSMTIMSMLLEKAGQSVKSAVAKPVVVISDETWKSEYLKAFQNPPYSSMMSSAISTAAPSAMPK